ncbi:MAG: helicase HerA-like domain-containing protein [Sulfolobales archaeon]
MYISEVITAVAIAVLNIVIGISLGVSAHTTLNYLPLVPFVVAVCGFLVSKLRNVLIVFIEALLIAVIITTYSRFELLASFLFSYVLGLVMNFLRKKGPLDFKMWTPTNYYYIVFSLGCSLVGAGIVGLIGAPLETPLGALIKRGASAEILALTVAVYIVQGYISAAASRASLVVLALLSLLSPYTLPVLAVLPYLDGATKAHLRNRFLKAGKVVEVIKGVRTRELLIPFEKGLNRNIVIVGATGTGKSTLAKHLVNQVRALGVPVVVFDAHGEYCRECGECECVDATELSVDIFRVYEEDPKTRAEFVADVISEIYSLGNLQRIALSKALSQVYGVAHGGLGFDYLLEYVWRASYGEIDLGVPQLVVRSLVPYLEKLRNALKTGGKSIVEFVNGVTVVDYSRLSSGVATIISEIAIDELYHTFKDLGREFVLVVDEAHRFLRKGRALSKLFREGRKYGISSILITQDVNSIPRELLLNAATLISFSLPEISTARYVAKIVSPGDTDLYEKILSKLTSLPQFHALVFIPGLGSYIVDTRKPNPTR